MEQFLAEYFVNSIWQVRLLVLGAWLLLRALRPSARVQHWIWIGVLPLVLVMPLLSMRSGLATHVQVTVAPSSPMLDVDLTPAAFPIPAQVLEHASPEDTSGQPAPQLVATSPAKPWLSAWSERLHRPLVRELELGPAATLFVVGFYLATMAFALIRLLFGWRAARRVIAQARPAILNCSESLLLDQCCRRLGVRRPEVLQSSEVRSPMVVGALHPSLLLPEGLANRNFDSPDRPSRDLEAVLLHELAHLQRRDCLANLVCRIIALPVAYHPATWAVRQRIRQTQEMLCDAIAAAEMQSPIKYARCLVGLAQNMQSTDRRIAQIYGATMFDGRILEERVMQLIETRKTQSVRTRMIRVTCGIAVAIAVLAAAATFHVTPTLAQTPSPVVATQPTAASDSARSGQSNPAQTTVEADTPESAQQIENAARQFDAAMKIVKDRLARSFNRDIQHEQHAAIEKQSDEARVEAQIASAQQDAQNAQTSAQAMLRDSELQEHLADIQAKFNSLEFKKQMADMQAKFNSPEFKEKTKHIADAQAKFDSPEFKKQMADMQAKFNSPEFKEKMKHIADAQAKFDSPEFKKQMADMQAKFNSPEFKEKMKELNSAEFQRQIADATARVNNPEFRRQLEDLNQKYRDQLQQLLRQFNNDPSAPHAPLPSPSPQTHPAPQPAPAPPTIP